MVRQVVSLYEKYLGVRFIESDNQGFTIAVGDMQAIDPTLSLTPIEANRPGGLTYAAGPLCRTRRNQQSSSTARISTRPTITFSAPNSSGRSCAVSVSCSDWAMRMNCRSRRFRTTARSPIPTWKMSSQEMRISSTGSTFSAPRAAISICIDSLSLKRVENFHSRSSLNAKRTRAFSTGHPFVPQ